MSQPENVGRSLADDLQVNLQSSSLGRAGWCLVASCCTGCVQPELWAFPAAPEGAQAYALEIDGPQPHLLLGDIAETRRALAEAEGRPRAVAYFAPGFEQLATPGLLLPTAPLECDRSRPLPHQALAAYREEPTGEWQSVAEGLPFGAFRMPPIDLHACLASGCLGRGGGAVLCKTTCEPPLAPHPPAPAACPLGWLPRADGTAGCTSPTPTSCASEPCWLSPPGSSVGCSARPRPPGTTLPTGPTLSTVGGAVWLPKGRYQGPVVMEPGAALYGECPEETVVVGGIRLSGSATVAALTIEATNEQSGLLIFGRGNRVKAVRVIGGPEGISVAAAAEVEVHSARLHGPETCVGINRAEVKLDHLWCSDPSMAGLVGGGDIEIADAVLESSELLEGGWIFAAAPGSPARGRVTGRRLLVFGANRLAFRVAQAFDLSDLRIDGRGRIGSAILVDGVGAVGQIRNVEASALGGPAVWVKDHAIAQILDLRATDVESGLSLTSSVTLRRVHIEGSKVEGLEGTDDLNLDVQDLRIVGAVEGLRVAPDDRGTQSAKLRRVLIEGAAIGLARSGGAVHLDQVMVRGCRQGIRTSVCLVDEVLSGVQLEDVATPVLYDDP